MNKFYRRLILIIFVIVFFISTPIIIMYTSGYRYNFEKGRVQKTGILILSTIPRKAQIYLNGKLEDKTTPAELKHVLPGDYIITLQKEGYHPWVKKLPIYENATTFGEKIMLWKKSTPKILSESFAKVWSQSTDKKLAYQNERLYIFSLNDESFENFSSSNTEQISWSDSNKKFILTKINNGKKYFEINNLKPQAPLIIKDFIKVSWAKNNDESVYGLNETGIWKINLNNESKELAYKITNINDFFIEGSKLYLIIGKNIFTHDLKSSSTKQLLCEVKKSDYKFESDNYNKLVLLNNSGSIAVIDKSNLNKPLEIRAKKLEWLNKDVFLYYNDFEIIIFDLNKNENKIITRVSQPITQGVWHPQGKHIIYASGSNINIIEVDDRELRNVIQLADEVSVNFMSLSSNGKNLYFSGKFKGKEGFYKLELQ